MVTSSSNFLLTFSREGDPVRPTKVLLLSLGISLAPITGQEITVKPAAAHGPWHVATVPAVALI